MTHRIGFGLSLFGCVFLASCYPFPERPPVRKTTTQQQQVQENPVVTEKKTTTETDIKPTDPTGTGDNTTTPPEIKKDPEVKKTDYVFASKVPGKDGFVFSPYNNKVVDVRDIPSGTLVMDPTYSPSEKKYFRVP
ncbi:MAG: hypothetical protein V4733_08130 [Verrucomicrobiota bacterium]